MANISQNDVDQCSGCNRVWDGKHYDFEIVQGNALAPVYFSSPQIKFGTKKCMLCHKQELEEKSREGKKSDEYEHVLAYPALFKEVIDQNKRMHINNKGQNMVNLEDMNWDDEDMLVSQNGSSDAKYEAGEHKAAEDKEGKNAFVNIKQDVNIVNTGSELVDDENGGCLNSFVTCYAFEGDKKLKNKPRKYNLLWTGKDPAQIGVFVRHLRIEDLKEETMTIVIKFYLNLVWLDKELCNHFKKVRKLRGNNWYTEVNADNYNVIWNSLVRESRGKKKFHASKWPLTKIESIKPGGYTEHQNVFSFNKGWIGPDTVYWRRLITAEVSWSPDSDSYPVGHETFQLKINLDQYSGQRLVLFRSLLWYNWQVNMRKNEQLAAKSFAFINPSNEFLNQWCVCSAHGHADRFQSCFDSNKFIIRLPSTVNDGLNTESSYQALIVLKRKSRWVFFNVGIWFAMTPTILLVTYGLPPKDDLDERLNIAVGVLFIQVQLKNWAAAHTPRMRTVTMLDWYMVSSFVLVLGQIIAQISSESLEEINDSLLIVNCFVVVFVQFLFYLWANNAYARSREEVEGEVRQIFGFADNEKLMITYKDEEKTSPQEENERLLATKLKSQEVHLDDVNVLARDE